MAQLMTRLGLDWCGNYNPAAGPNTFAAVVILFCLYYATSLLGIGIISAPIMAVYAIVIFTKTPDELRRRYRIPSEICHCCMGMGEDCCMTTCFPCCSSIQMARQTHNEYRYPYQFDTPTGLPVNTPLLY